MTKIHPGAHVVALYHYPTFFGMGVVGLPALISHAKTHDSERDGPYQSWLTNPAPGN